MRKNWFLPAANIACLIHCVGMGLFSASAPIWLSGLHLEWIEYSLIFFNLFVGLHVFKSLPMPKYRIYILVSGITISFLSLLFEFHNYYHWSVGFTAVYQIFTLIQFHNKKHHGQCNCVQHKKQKELSKLIKKWQQEPISPEDEKNWEEFQKELNKNRFHIPDRKD